MQNEVIIDGCNVAECELCSTDWKNRYVCEITSISMKYNHFCNENPNCYFKQLQRAKAENETLHITIEKLKGDLYIAEDSLRDYQEHYNKLEAENEKLKAMTGVYSVRLMKKYKQALEDIRELGEKTGSMKLIEIVDEVLKHE